MGYVDAKQVAVIEAFQGEQWRKGEKYRNPAYKTGQKIQSGYMNHLECLYGSLMLQSHLSDLNDAIKVSLKADASESSTNINDYSLDFSGVESLLTAENDARRAEFLRSLAAIYGSNEWVLSAMREGVSDWVYEYECYAEYLSHGVFDGLHHRQNDFVGDCGCSGGLRDNVFQTMDGGADRLEGRGGGDTYHLGYGTGHDRIEEKWRDSDWDGDENDVIKVAPGVGTELVKLSPTRDDLIVTLFRSDGTVDSSLTVKNYYVSDAAKVERVELSDGTLLWDAEDFTGVSWIAPVYTDSTTEIVGGSGDDTLEGKSNANDVFDSDGGGNDRLYGYGGDDVYWLGGGTGHDVIREYYYNDGDVIKLKSGITISSVNLRRSGNSLVVELLDSKGVATDSLRVENHYTDTSAKIERIEADGQMLLEKQFQSLIDELASFNAGESSFSTADRIYAHYWGDDTTLSSSN